MRQATTGQKTVKSFLKYFSREANKINNENLEWLKKRKEVINPPKFKAA